MAKSKKKKHNSFFGARLTSTISTSLVLFLLGIIALLGVMATQLTVYVRGNMGFSVVLDENVTDAQIKTLQKRLTAAPYARKVQYISKSDALKELYMELGENPEDLLGYNPLRPSFEVKLNSDYADATKLAGIDKTLRSAYPYIENVSYQKDLIELVNDNLKLIGLILLGIAVVMTVISVVLIANTVSLVAYSKRFLLHAMVLVGATPAFIRRPFVRSHIVNGIFGALIANGLLGALLYYMSRELSGFSSLLDKEMLLFIAGGILLAGIVLSYLAARIAVGRYLTAISCIICNQSISVYDEYENRKRYCSHDGEENRKNRSPAFCVGASQFTADSGCFCRDHSRFRIDGRSRFHPRTLQSRHIQFQTHRIGADDRFPRFCFHGICHFVQRS